MLRAVGFLIGILLMLAAAFWAGPALGLDKHPYFAALIATVVGVFAGGALALGSDRLQESLRLRDERMRDVNRRQDDRLRVLELQRRVVGLLHDELSVNADALADPAGRAMRPRPDLFYTPLVTATWEALSASGEVAHVPNPDLLGALAEAYHWVILVNRYERQMLDLQFHPAGVTGALIAPPAGGKALREALDRLKDQLVVLDPPARQVIGTAVDMTNETFGVIETEMAAIREDRAKGKRRGADERG